MSGAPGLDPAALDALVERAEQLGADEAGLAALRREWPGVHFTLCGEDDVPARLAPFRVGPGFDLYLVSNASHCIGFTTQAEFATGVVLAVRSESP